MGRWQGAAMRYLAFLYGIICYVLFLGVFLGAIAFVGDLVPMIPVSVDRGPAAPLEIALGIDALLLTLFAVQHSVMARPAFKRVWTRVVSPAIERSTYVLFSSSVLLLLLVFWHPLPSVLFTVGAPAGMVLSAIRWLGWGVVLISTFMISHFDLFGLKQVYANLKRQRLQDSEFQTFGLYRLVRHPIMVGFLIAFWATPTMTLGHLVFAFATTGYILIALRFEEADLVRAHGDLYREYQARVPMLVPIPKAATPRPVRVPAE
jgi:protein-S-isoprenylcysteine O-methyltransferase Ste14